MDRPLIAFDIEVCTDLLAPSDRTTLRMAVGLDGLVDEPSQRWLDLRTDEDLVRLMGRGVDESALRSRTLACAIRIAREIEADLCVVLVLATVDMLARELAGDGWTVRFVVRGSPDQRLREPSIGDGGARP